MGRQQGPGTAGRGGGRGRGRGSEPGRGGGRGRGWWRNRKAGGRGANITSSSIDSSGDVNGGSSGSGVGAPLQEAADRAKAQTQPQASGGGRPAGGKNKRRGSRATPSPQPLNVQSRHSQTPPMASATVRADQASATPIATIGTTVAVSVEALADMHHGFRELAQRLDDIGKCATEGRNAPDDEISQHVSRARTVLGGMQDMLDALLGGGGGLRGSTNTSRTAGGGEEKKQQPPSQLQSQPRRAQPAAAPQSQPIASLGDLISSICSEYDYIVGLPSDFVAFLRSEDIETPDDLSMAVTECLDMLAKGGDKSSGDNPLTGILPGKEELFRDAVLAAISNEGNGVVDGVKDNADDADDEVLSVCAGGYVSAEASGAEGTGPWSCPTCTFSNPLSYLACSMCGTTAPREAPTAVGVTSNDHINAAAHPDPETELLLRQGIERQRQEEEKMRTAATAAAMARKEEEEKTRRREEARRQRERARQAKQEEARRIAEEEEKAAAEADRLRRLETQREKEAAIAKYSYDTEQAAASAKSSGAIVSVAANKVLESKKLVALDTPRSTSTSVATGGRFIGSGASTPARKATSSVSDSPRRRNNNSKLLYGNRLATFIAPSMTQQLGKATNVSPIFAFIQDESLAESGRQLILLENDTKRCKEELSELLRQKTQLEGGIVSEKKVITDKEKNIRRLQRETENKYSVTGFVSWTKKMTASVLADMDKAEEEGEAVSAEDKAAMSIREREAKKKEDQRNKMNRSQRYAAVKKAKEEIDHEQNRIKLTKTSVDDLQMKLQALSVPISLKETELESFRLEISKIKGEGEKEDDAFNLDGNRTEEGNSFMHVAAMNNDFETARTCLQLGANPNVINVEGFTPAMYAGYFGFDEIVGLIIRNGGHAPLTSSKIWSGLNSAHRMSKENSRNWDLTLEGAQSAAVPAEQLIESPEECEKSKERRMPNLSNQERRSMDFACFEARLLDSNINSDVMHRVVLLEKKVYEWTIVSNRVTLASFARVLEGLKPSPIRDPGVKQTVPSRRAVIGNVKTFELLAAPFADGTGNDQVVIFTPFVSGEVRGVSSVGVIVWAIAPDREASLYKTLIANAEFSRHKAILDDRFAPHSAGVLELGKDMHLLDLYSTSIWTTSAMELFIIDLDGNDLDRIQYDPSFSAKKRIVYSQEVINQAIFRQSAEESKDNEEVLLNERHDMSTHLSGGAGTGKTLLMIKRVCSEDPSRKILVLSRLPRLVSIMKAKVEAERDISTVSFLTYDDLLALLARRTAPTNEGDYRSFSTFNHVRFDCGVEGGISFLSEFIGGYLNGSERSRMAKYEIAPLTLWAGIITIKSNARCAVTKTPLTRESYLGLGPSFGLRQEQREIVYGFFLQYQEWISQSESHAWDEADRSMYVLRHGPSVFSDDKFVPWTERVEAMGEIDLLDGDGDPLHPFFFDMIFCDEAQDFSELDLALLLRMSAGLRSVFIGADSAQSVEQGIKMRAGTINDVFHWNIKSSSQMHVKDVLQVLGLNTNHRTHSQNLALGKAIRRILTRSFDIPNSNETAIVEGRQSPRALSIKKLSDLIDTNIFVAPNVVFLAPDEKIHELRALFRDLKINNDLFSVREAKGLEFDSVALLGFFSHFEELGSSKEWKNVLRWLSSDTSLRKTSSDEVVSGVMLEDCDYRLSHPETSSQAMVLYTAITRARNAIYLIESDVTSIGKKSRQGGSSLSNFAFRRFKDLKLVETVSSINEGHAEMTPAQHKARGVVLVTQAISMVRDRQNIGSVRDAFNAAIERFEPNKGNDAELLRQAQRHLDAVLEKHSLTTEIKDKFFIGGEYVLEGRFAGVCSLEKRASSFFASFSGDPFLVEEIHEMRVLLEEIFLETPYEGRFALVFETIRKLESFV